MNNFGHRISYNNNGYISLDAKQKLKEISNEKK